MTAPVAVPMPTHRCRKVLNIGEGEYLGGGGGGKGRGKLFVGGQLIEEPPSRLHSVPNNYISHIKTDNIAKTRAPHAVANARL